MSILDHLMWVGIFLLSSFCVFVLVVLAWLMYTAHSSCARWDNKLVYKESWTQYFPIAGKTTMMLPVYRPAGFYKQTYCVEVK